MPYCPECRGEYIRSMTVCPRCEVALVESLDDHVDLRTIEGRLDALGDRDVVPVFEGPLTSCHEVGNLLAEHGIPSAVFDSDRDFPGGIAPTLRVGVAEDDVERAAQVFRAVADARLAAEGVAPDAAPGDASEPEGEGSMPCPACGAEVPDDADECPDCGLMLG